MRVQPSPRDSQFLATKCQVLAKAMERTSDKSQMNIYVLTIIFYFNWLKKNYIFLNSLEILGKQDGASVTGFVGGENIYVLN